MKKNKKSSLQTWDSTLFLILLILLLIYIIKFKIDEQQSIENRDVQVKSKSNLNCFNRISNNHIHDILRSRKTHHESETVFKHRFVKRIQQLNKIKL